jgi:hypothetical protein
MLQTVIKNSGEIYAETKIIDNIIYIFKSKLDYSVDELSIRRTTSYIHIDVIIDHDTIILNSELKKLLKEYTIIKKIGEIGITIIIKRNHAYPLYYYSVYYFFICIIIIYCKLYLEDTYLLLLSNFLYWLYDEYSRSFGGS